MQHPHGWKSCVDLLIGLIAPQTESDFPANPAIVALSINTSLPLNLQSAEELAPFWVNIAKSCKMCDIFINCPKHRILHATCLKTPASNIHYIACFSRGCAFDLTVATEVLQWLHVFLPHFGKQCSPVGPMWQPGGVEETGRAAVLLRLAERPLIWASAQCQTPPYPRSLDIYLHINAHTH